MLQLFYLLIVPVSLAANASYYVAFPPNHPAISSTITALYISSSSEHNVSFTVQSVNGVIFEGRVNASSPVVKHFEANYVPTTMNYADREKGLLIEATGKLLINPVNSIFLEQGASADTYHALEYHDLSLPLYEYHAVTAVSSTSTGSSSFILMIGTANDCEMTITPSQDIAIPEDPQDTLSRNIDIEAFVAHTFTLYKYQTLLVLGGEKDLTGSHISSTKPLTVITGHQCANIPTSASRCDQIVTQIPPIATWGKRYILTPFAVRKHNQKFTIVAGHNDTVINHTCSDNITSHTLHTAGSVLELFTTSYVSCVVIGSKPILVLMFSLSSESGSDTGGPAISILSPLEHYTTTISVFVLDSVMFAEQFLTITTIKEYFEPQMIVLDGQQLKCDWSIMWENVNYSSILGYTCKIATVPGPHIVSYGSSLGSLSVLVYGFHASAAYIYNANAEWIVPDKSYSGM